MVYTALIHARTHTHTHTHTHTGEFHGDTGSVTFERQLAAKWTCTAIHELPNWDNTTASLTLWTKNENNKNKKVAEKKPLKGDHVSQAGGRGLVEGVTHRGRWPVACVACGRAPVIGDARGGSGGGGGGGDSSEGGFLRDRMTRSVVVCSETCAQSTLTGRALADAFAAKHLPLPVRGGGGGGDEVTGGAGFRWAEKDLWRQLQLL